MTEPGDAPERARDGRGATPTPDRWRAVDAILQDAVIRPRDQRESFVSNACGEDEALRREVVSLLAAHDAAPHDFLERPAFESLGLVITPADAAPQRAAADDASHVSLLHGGATPSPQPRRMVPAWVAVYATVAGLAVGLAGGWLLSHSSLLDRWTSSNAALWQAGTAAVSVDRAGAPTHGLTLAVVSRDGRPLRTVAADRPWTPRFSPDGRRVAYGAFGGRQTSDLWVADVDAGTTRRLTDDGADSNDPQWSPDGKVLAYSANAPGGKDVAELPLDGGAPHVLASRPGTQFPSDWLRDGSALLVTEDAGADRYDILVQPSDGSAARPYAATRADERTARISPDGRWVAYTSDASGRAEVYLDSYRRPGRRVLISEGGGVDPAWRRDGRELYYWRDGALVAVQLAPAAGDAAPIEGEQRVLFRAPYQPGVNTMYDVSADGQRFVIVERH